MCSSPHLPFSEYPCARAEPPAPFVATRPHIFHAESDMPGQLPSVPPPSRSPQSKNIVICCDGTGNEFGPHNSNVVRIYTTLDLNDDTRQVAYYHPGVGTMGAPTARNWVEKQWSVLTGLAFGVGFRDNVFD